MPDYRGRAAPPINAGDVLIWVPRALLYPAHLTLEYVVRRPIVGAITLVEKHHLQSWVKRIFVWRENKVGLLPTALYEFGIDPSFGFYFFHDDLFHPAHDLVLRGGFWPDDWVSLRLEDKVTLLRDDSGLWHTTLAYLRRPDRPFHGLGPATTQGDERFYRVEQIDAQTALSGRFGPLNRATLSAGYRRLQFRDGERPPVSQLFAAQGGPPPGFDGYHLLEGRLSLELDSRGKQRRYSSGSGLRLELFGGLSADPTHTERFIGRWGGEAAAFLDLTGANHVLGLRGYVEIVEQLGDEPVPFTELATLGGRELMRGFLEGRFRGDSAFVVTAQYRYPVWSLMDALLFVSAGNVFDGRLEQLHAKRLFLSYGLGLRTNTDRTLSFDALLALGSHRLDQDDVGVDHVHFVFGINSGF